MAWSRSAASKTPAATASSSSAVVSFPYPLIQHFSPPSAGAVGIEIAAEIKHHHPTKNVILIHSRNQLLSNEPLPLEFKERTLAIVEEEGVRVLLNNRAAVVAQPDGTSTVTLTDGRVIRAGKVITAISKWTPVSGALPAQCLTDEGYVKVTAR